MMTTTETASTPRLRAICCDAREVRGLLSGEVGQIRRVVKENIDGVTCDGIPFRYAPIEVVKDRQVVRFEGTEKGKFVSIIRGRYQAGDLTCVREQFLATEYPAPPVIFRDRAIKTPTGWAHVHYRADDMENKPSGWKSPALMPRWASRLTLEVCGVRVQRLRDISESDVLASGIPKMQSTAEHPIGCNIPDFRWYYGFDEWDRRSKIWTTDPVDAFCEEWEIVHGYESSKANPWVWVYDVRKVERGAD